MHPARLSGPFSPDARVGLSGMPTQASGLNVIELCLDLDKRIADNVAAIRRLRITGFGRSPRAETMRRTTWRLIAVTKYASQEQIRAVAAAGCHDLGESRPQQLCNRAALLTDLLDVRWHMIGHLQRNKVEETLAVSPR